MDSLWRDLVADGNEQHPLIGAALAQIEECKGSVRDTMIRYDRERSKLLDLINSRCADTSLVNAVGQPGGLAARLAMQAGFGAAELILDLDSSRSSKPETLPGTVVHEVLGAVGALRRWQEAAQGRAELQLQQNASNWPHLQGAKGSEQIERWYYPLDVLRLNVTELDSALSKQLGSEYAGVLRDKAASTGSQVLRTLNALMRLCLRDAWEAARGHRPAYWHDPDLDELSRPLQFNLHEIAAEAHVELEVARSICDCLTLDTSEIELVSPYDRRHPFRADHPLLQTPLVAVGSEALLVAAPFQVGRAATMRIERAWMGSTEQSVYNAVRSASCESIGQTLLARSLGVSVGRNVKWAATDSNGELDLVLSRSNVGVVVECKSHQSPVKQSVAVSERPTAQLAAFDQAMSGENAIDLAGADAELAEVTAAQRHQARLVLLGTDYSTRTSALTFGVAGSSTESPVFLSIADLSLLCATLTPDEMALYLVVRYFHRREQLGAYLEEEVFLAAFLHSGAVDGMELHLKKQITTPRTRQRFGPIHDFLAWRNIYSSFGDDPPPRPGLRTPERMKPLVEAIRGSGTADAWWEYLVRWCWTEVFEVFCARAAIPVPSATPRIWFSLHDPRGVLHHVGIGCGPIAEISDRLHGESAAEAKKQLRLLDPAGKLVVTTLAWDPRSNECRVDYLTDPHPVLHPPLDFGRPLVASKTTPSRNEPCYCGSGGKRKRCEDRHHPDVSQLLTLP